MILRSALFGAAVVGAAAWFPTAVFAQKPITVQEALQRAKPAVVLVVAEVASEVTLDCGSGPQKITPPVYRETGTGWFLDADGWLITNGHVVQPAHEPPRWLANQQAQRAVTTACLPQVLKQMGLQPGDAPEREEAAKRKLLDTVLPTVKVNLQPQIFVVTAKGRLKAEVKKYSPPVSEMSAKDLALLKVAGDSFPVLPLADSRSVQVGDPVHILGFPGVVLSHELLSKSTMVDSVVTNGAVSAIQADASNNPLIQTDASAAWGNSGGPTVDDRGKVVGVLTFVSLAPGAEGAIVQGFNFVIPSAAVIDFVRGTSVKVNGPSKFNDVWYAGLTRLLRGGLHRRAAPLRGGRQAPPEPARRPAQAGRGAGVREEPAAQALPVVLGGGRRDPGERGRLRRPVAASLEQEPLPRPALRGGADDRDRQVADHPRRAQVRRLRAAPAQDPRLGAGGAGGPGQQHGGPRPRSRPAR